MADLEKLADATIALRPHIGRHIGLPLLARMAVKRAGITNNSDVKRLGKEVTRIVRRRNAIKEAAKPRRQR